MNQLKGGADFGYDVPKIVACKNRSAAYLRYVSTGSAVRRDLQAVRAEISTEDALKNRIYMLGVVAEIELFADLVF